MRNFFCFRTRNRTGRRTARGFAGITILRVLRRHGYYAARCSPTKKCGIAGKPHGTVKTVPYKPARNAEPSRDCAAIKLHRAVGAGHAPPATVYYNEHDGLVCRHGYYAARCSHTDIATQRINCTERSRPFPTNLPEMPYHPGILQQQNSPPRRGGASPARDITAAAIYRVNRIEAFPP